VVRLADLSLYPGSSPNLSRELTYFTLRPNRRIFFNETKVPIFRPLGGQHSASTRVHPPPIVSLYYPAPPEHDGDGLLGVLLAMSFLATRLRTAGSPAPPHNPMASRPRYRVILASSRTCSPQQVSGIVSSDVSFSLFLREPAADRTPLILIVCCCFLLANALSAAGSRFRRKLSLPLLRFF